MQKDLLMQINYHHSAAGIKTLLLLLLSKTSRLSWRKPKLQGYGTTVTKRLERVDVSDCKTAEKGESSDSS